MASSYISGNRLKARRLHLGSKIMSTDWEIGCQNCKKYTHLGQEFAGGQKSFGFGDDDKEGRDAVAYWIVAHMDCSIFGEFQELLVKGHFPDDWQYIDSEHVLEDARATDEVAGYPPSPTPHNS